MCECQNFVPAPSWTSLLCNAFGLYFGQLSHGVFFPVVTIGVPTFLFIASTFQMFCFQMFCRPKSFAKAKDHAEDEKMRTDKMIRKVCLFGTSANPPTIGGHKSILQSISLLEKFDEIRVLPVYKHMYSEKSDLAEFHHRLEMCKIAFRDIPNVNVSDQERVVFDYTANKEGITSEDDKRKLKVGTFDLLQRLDEENRNKKVKEEFTLAMGGDTFMDLTSLKKWKNPREIIRLLDGRFVVKLREGENSCSKSQIEERIEEVNKSFQEEISTLQLKVDFLAGHVSDSSSTAARKTNDEKELTRYLDKDVIEYIKANHLYRF